MATQSASRAAPPDSRAGAKWNKQPLKICGQQNKLQADSSCPSRLAAAFVELEPAFGQTPAASSTTTCRNAGDMDPLLQANVSDPLWWRQQRHWQSSLSREGERQQRQLSAFAPQEVGFDETRHNSQQRRQLLEEDAFEERDEAEETYVEIEKPGGRLVEQPQKRAKLAHDERAISVDKPQNESRRVAADWSETCRLLGDIHPGSDFGPPNQKGVNSDCIIDTASEEGCCEVGVSMRESSLRAGEGQQIPSDLVRRELARREQACANAATVAASRSSAGPTTKTEAQADASAALGEPKAEAEAEAEAEAKSASEARNADSSSRGGSLIDNAEAASNKTDGGQCGFERDDISGININNRCAGDSRSESVGVSGGGVGGSNESAEREEIDAGNKRTVAIGLARSQQRQQRDEAARTTAASDGANLRTRTTRSKGGSSSSSSSSASSSPSPSSGSGFSSSIDTSPITNSNANISSTSDADNWQLKRTPATVGSEAPLDGSASFTCPQQLPVGTDLRRVHLSVSAIGGGRDNSSSSSSISSVAGESGMSGGIGNGAASSTNNRRHKIDSTGCGDNVDSSISDSASSRSASRDSSRGGPSSSSSSNSNNSRIVQQDSKLPQMAQIIQTIQQQQQQQQQVSQLNQAGFLLGQAPSATTPSAALDSRQSMIGQRQPENHNNEKSSSSSASEQPQQQQQPLQRQYPPNHPLGNTKHLCSICGDRATGKHYGVFSCEGCKGFFKRTIRKDIVYVCRASGQCLIDMRQRNRCQYCRYQKCLRKGMKREAVQEEKQRIKLRACGLTSSNLNLNPNQLQHQHQQPMQCDSQTSMIAPNPNSIGDSASMFAPAANCQHAAPYNPYKFELDNQPASHQSQIQLSSFEPIEQQQQQQQHHHHHNQSPHQQQYSGSNSSHQQANNYLQAQPQQHQSSNTHRYSSVMRDYSSYYNSEHQQSQSQFSLHQQSNGSFGNSNNLNGHSAAVGLFGQQKKYAQGIDEVTLGWAAEVQVQRLVEWARSVPKFQELLIDDQITLLKTHWNELIISDMVYKSIKALKENQPLSQRTLCIGRDLHITQEQAHEIGLSSMFERIINELVVRMCDMRVDEDEIACLRAIILFNPETQGLKSSQPIEEYRSNVYTALENYCRKSYPDEPNRFGKLLLRLPALRSIGLKCNSLQPKPSSSGSSHLSQSSAQEAAGQNANSLPWGSPASCSSSSAQHSSGASSSPASNASGSIICYQMKLLFFDLRYMPSTIDVFLRSHLLPPT